MTPVEITGLIVAICGALPYAVKLYELIAATAKAKGIDAKLAAGKQAAAYAEEVFAANPELKKTAADAGKYAADYMRIHYPKMPVTEVSMVVKAALPLLGIGAAAKNGGGFAAPTREQMAGAIGG